MNKINNWVELFNNWIELVSDDKLLYNKITDFEFENINPKLTIFLKFIYYGKKFGKRFIKYCIKRKNAVFFIIFAIFIIYQDKNTRNKITSKKSLSPNIIYTVIAVFLYLPAWFQIIGGNVFRLTLMSDPKLSAKILHEIWYPLYIMNRLEAYFFAQMTFETIYYLSLYYGLKYYMKELWDIHKGKRTWKMVTWIYMPMYLKYHMYYVAVVETLFESLKWGFDTLFKFLLTPVAMPLRLSVMVNLQWFWVAFATIVTGYGFWKAIRGISFLNDGFIDNFIRLHLGAECLDPREQWQDYGMDDYKKKYY